MHVPATTLGMPAPYHFPATSTFRVPLRSPVLKALWQVVLNVGALFLVGFQAPFWVALWITQQLNIKPLHSFVYNIARTVYDWTAPLVNLTQSLSFSVFEFFDTMWHRGTEAVLTVHHANMAHMSVALEAYTRLIQEKSALIERHGVRGIPLVFTSHTAKAA